MVSKCGKGEKFEEGSVEWRHRISNTFSQFRRAKDAATSLLGLVYNEGNGEFHDGEGGEGGGEHINMAILDDRIARAVVRAVGVDDMFQEQVLAHPDVRMNLTLCISLIRRLAFAHQVERTRPAFAALRAHCLMAAQVAAALQHAAPQLLVAVRRAFDTWRILIAMQEAEMQAAYAANEAAAAQEEELEAELQRRLSAELVARSSESGLALSLSPEELEFHEAYGFQMIVGALRCAVSGGLSLPPVLDDARSMTVEVTVLETGRRTSFEVQPEHLRRFHEGTPDEVAGDFILIGKGGKCIGPAPPPGSEPTSQSPNLGGGVSEIEYRFAHPQPLPTAQVYNVLYQSEVDRDSLSSTSSGVIVSPSSTSAASESDMPPYANVRSRAPSDTPVPAHSMPLSLSPPADTHTLPLCRCMPGTCTSACASPRASPLPQASPRRPKRRWRHLVPCRRTVRL